MHHIKTGKLRKHMSAMMAVIMAVSLAVPAGLSFSARTVSAADKTVEAKAASHNYYVMVLVLRFILKKSWDNILHNESALLLRLRLLWKKDIVVATLPYHFKK